MSSICDQACVFCSESVRMAQFARHPISCANIVKTLIRKKRDGCNHVTFTGGEPTLHPKFLEILQAAKRLGYTTYATSDGSRLASKEFALKALPLLDELCLSVHGDCPGVHDPLAKSPGSFARVMEAIAHISSVSKKPYLLTNTVVTQANLGSIESTIHLLTHLSPVRHCTISNLAPDGEALKNFTDLAVRLKELKEMAPRLYQIARERGAVLRFFGVPLCMLGEEWDLPNDLHWSPRVTVERGMVEGQVGLQEITSFHPGRLRVFAPKCEGCRVKGKCFGVFQTYLKRYGDEELIPFV
ncbi:MAG: radical SAM protein [Elusimicrobia bacterium]|nr:radical SAM protein [Elusimicrobiota bacterium]